MIKTAFKRLLNKLAQIGVFCISPRKGSFQSHGCKTYRTSKDMEGYVNAVRKLKDAGEADLAWALTGRDDKHFADILAKTKAPESLKNVFVDALASKWHLRSEYRDVLSLPVPWKTSLAQLTQADVTLDDASYGLSALLLLKALKDAEHIDFDAKALQILSP